MKLYLQGCKERDFACGRRRRREGGRVTGEGGSRLISKI